MKLSAQLQQEMIAAIKAGDKVKRGTLGYLVSEIKNAQIDQGELDDAAVLKLIARQVKQMKEAIADFQKGDRPDLVKAEQAKVAILEQYLPQQLPENELAVIIDQVLADMEEPKMGQVMAAVMTKVAGKADGGSVSRIVKQKLASQ